MNEKGQPNNTTSSVGNYEYIKSITDNEKIT